MTCENYTCNNANAVEREQERKLTVKNKENVNYDISKSCKNVILEHDSKIDEYKSFRAYVKAYKEENNIGGRFNIDTACDRNATKVLSCFVMSASSDLISSMTRKEQVEYFRCGLDFLKTEYPTFHIVDSRIHFDEKGLPHLHTSMLPIHEKEDGSKSFNVSQHQKGKDYFRGFQDRFYEYMKEHYPDKELQRINPKRDHDKKMTVKEYKENLNEKIEKKAKIAGELSPAGSELKSLINERAEYEAKLNNSEKALVAPKAGLVSYRVDSLENVLTYDSISLLTSTELSKMKTTLNQIIPINTKNVKLIDNFECYIAVPMTSEEAYKAKLNDIVYLRFKNTGDSLIQGTIEYISKEEDCVLLVFKIKSNVEELTKYRKIGFDVVWWSSTGLKVNKDVIYHSKLPVIISGDQSGDVNNLSAHNSSVELATINVKKAYYTNEVFVKILKETSEFVIIDNYTDSELRNMGVAESIIENRSTIKLYDEALVGVSKENI